MHLTSALIEHTHRQGPRSMAKAESSILLKGEDSALCCIELREAARMRAIIRASAIVRHSQRLA